MNYTLDVNTEVIRKQAESAYGPYYCSEAIVSVLRDNFKLDMPEEIIAMASSFPVGIGGSMCLCGAMSGGLMMLGLFFGRTTPGDAKIDKNMQLAAEMHDWFKKASGKNALCCRVLCRGMEMGSEEHLAQCTRLTGMVAEKTAEIIVRELGDSKCDDRTSST